MESVPNPLIDFGTFDDRGELPDADTLDKYYRHIVFFIGHFGFFMFNFLNVSYMVLIQGLVLGNLSRCRRLQLTLVGCLLQIASCVTSLTRYNMVDEYNGWGIAGIVLSFVGYCFMNYSCSVVIFKSNKKPILITTGVWALLAVILLVLNLVTWEANKFLYFRVFLGLATFYQLVSMCVGYYHLKKGTISTDPSIISNDAMKKLFLLLLVLDIIGMAALLSTVVILIYPATGLTLNVVVIMLTSLCVTWTLQLPTITIKRTKKCWHCM